MTVTVQRSEARRVCDFEKIPDYGWFFFAGQVYIKIRSSNLTENSEIMGRALIVETGRTEAFEDITLVTPLDVMIYYKEMPAIE